MSDAILYRPETYGNPGQTQSWSYDAAGNRSDSVVDALNRATSVGGVACGSDVLGNRTSTGGRGLGWDCLNRLAFVTDPSPTTGYALVGQYGYRADGMRTLKYAPNALSVYRHDGQMGIEDEEWSTDHFVTRYGLGARGVDMIERTSSSGTVTAFPLYDAHGNNVASLTRDGSGGYALADRRSYDAWGVVRSQQSGGDPKLRYCANLGHRQDDETGLVYMRARYYEPGSGRFLSEDPAADGGNWFVYCGNDPTNFGDSTGKARRTTYSFGDWEVSFDPSFGDWHASLNGDEVLSRFYSGGVKHAATDAGDKMLTKFLTALKDAMKSGNTDALACGKKMRANGVIGISEHLGFAIVAITSLDAYAQANPEDFADIIKTIGMCGKNPD